jgi:Tfp pilus assembly protein FimT
MFPNLSALAAKINAFQTQQRNLTFPGSSNIMKNAGTSLNSLISGQVPTDVIGNTERAVAAATGGGFNPFTGGGNSQQAFARSIGTTSTNLMTQGLSMAPTWESLSNSFLTNPTSLIPGSLQAGNQQYQYDALNAGQSLNAQEFNTSMSQNAQEFNSNQAFNAQQFDSTSGYNAGANAALFQQNQNNTQYADQLAQQNLGISAATGLANASRGLIPQTPSGQNYGNGGGIGGQGGLLGGLFGGGGNYSNNFGSDMMNSAGGYETAAAAGAGGVYNPQFYSMGANSGFYAGT